MEIIKNIIIKTATTRFTYTSNILQPSNLEIIQLKVEKLIIIIYL
jgi:hypothetical protein